MRHLSTATRRGFTLIELAIVVLIIGLIISFILVTGYAGVEQSRLRATQALITKLEVALNDRLDALLSVQVKPNGAHKYLATVIPSTWPQPQAYIPWGLTSDGRAEVIARLDQIKREMPDVFYIQTKSPGNDDYFVNFAGLPYPVPSNGFGAAQTASAYILPLGNRAGPGFTPSPTPPPATGYTAAALDPDGDGNPNTGPGAFVGVAAGAYGNPVLIPQTAYGGVADEGIYGASYAARAALLKLIGCTQLGTDGADNTGEGLTDEYRECIRNADGTTNGAAVTSIQRFLDNHTHNTARSEMLYALLVEGTGPLGNVFSAGDFRSNEVMDTDDDGLPEFVDGWGTPLQFYRWPIFHPAQGLQVGSAAYGSVSQVREVFPLDQNKQLVAPAWFGATGGTTSDVSTSAQLIHSYFVNFSDLDYRYVTGNSTGPPYASLWDITGFYPRRAYACKFLVLSAGPDQEFGVKILTDSDIANLMGTPDSIAVQIIGNPGNPNASGNTPIPGEGWAPYINGYPLPSVVNGGITAPPDVALDNITNLELQSESGGIR